MKEVLDYLLVGGSLALVAWMLSAIIHVILHFCDVWDKISIEIKLPKRKRFTTKVDPIYQLEESDFGGGYIIRKWELGYDDSFGLQMLMMFIPYPIKLLKYQYVTTTHVWLPDETKIKEITEDIGVMFERIWAINNKEKLEKERIVKEHQDNLGRINKVFNENFEK